MAVAALPPSPCWERRPATLCYKTLSERNHLMAILVPKAGIEDCKGADV